MTGHFTSYKNRTDHELATRATLTLTPRRYRRTTIANGQQKTKGCP